MALLDGIIAIAILIVPSALIWKLIHSVVFRITKDDDRPVLVAAVFVGVMLALAVLCGLSNSAIYHKEMEPDAWLFWPFIYCAGAAALILVGLALKAFGFAFESVVAAIRGD